MQSLKSICVNKEEEEEGRETLSCRILHVKVSTFRPFLWFCSPALFWVLLLGFIERRQSLFGLSFFAYRLLGFTPLKPFFQVGFGFCYFASKFIALVRHRLCPVVLALPLLDYKRRKRKKDERERERESFFSSHVISSLFVFRDDEIIICLFPCAMCPLQVLSHSLHLKTQMVKCPNDSISLASY